MRIRPLLFALLILPLCGLAAVHAQGASQAAANPSFKASLPVADTSDAQRNHAFAVALGSILVRTAGQQVTGAPGFTDALGNAASLVQDYQYQRAAEGASQPFVLSMEFDPSAVQLLAQKLQQQLVAAQPAGAASAPAPQATTVWVAPLASAMDMARLLSALRADPKVASAEPVGADADGVLIRIESASGLAGLIASLQTSGHLVQATDAHPGADASLRWVH